MEYRILPHRGERISVIGLGSGSITGTQQEMTAIIDAAIQNGINYFDMAPSEKAPFAAYAAAFAGRREQILTQMHFGAIYKGGKYGWTRKLDDIKEQFDWELKLLDTSYTDMGFIHCIDDQEDLEGVMDGGLWDYMKALKAEGKIRHLGFSSHNPDIARRILDTGLVDMMMFSINPAYDYRQGEYAIGEVAERAALYRECESMGVGISVMKPFAGGQLLSAKTGYPQCGGSANGAALCRGHSCGKGLFRRRGIHPSGCGWRLRLLQSLPALPQGLGCGTDQQVLRPCPRRRRDGGRALC